MNESITVKSHGLNASTLKIIAIIGMTLDHIGNAFWDYLPDLARLICFAPGGLTFPIMAYLLTEGYKHTRNHKKYALRLFIFALISLVPYVISLNFYLLNILFTLLLGLITIYLYDHMKNRFLFSLAFIGITLASLFCDWALIGVPMILCYHTIQNPKRRVIIPVLIAWMLIVIPIMVSIFMNSGFQLMEKLPGLLYGVIGCTATIPLLLHYNGSRGKPMKYFFYAYYPVHLAIIALLRFALLGI